MSVEIKKVEESYYMVSLRDVRGNLPENPLHGYVRTVHPFDMPDEKIIYIASPEDITEELLNKHGFDDSEVIEFVNFGCIKVASHQIGVGTAVLHYLL